MTAVVDVLIIEDHRLLAQSLALALRQSGLTVRVADVPRSTRQELLEGAARCVVLDLDLGTDADGRSLDGVDLLPAWASARVPVVVTTGSDDLSRWGACLVAGASTVLSKTEPVEVLAEVVHALLAGRTVTAASWRHEAVRAWHTRRQERALLMAPLRRLTPREATVLDSLAEGSCAAAIAARDVVSEATVRSQIKSILHKLEVTSQLQAVAILHRARATSRR